MRPLAPPGGPIGKVTVLTSEDPCSPDIYNVGSKTTLRFKKRVTVVNYNLDHNSSMTLPRGSINPYGQWKTTLFKEISQVPSWEFTPSAPIELILPLQSVNRFPSLYGDKQRLKGEPSILSLEYHVWTENMSIEKNFDIPFVADLALVENQIQQNYCPVIAVHKWFARRPGPKNKKQMKGEDNETVF